MSDPGLQDLLVVDRLSVRYGNVEAVKGVDLRLRIGEITALVGANGAGKSTTLLAISGLVPLSGGTIRFDAIDVHRLAPHRIVENGIVQVAEGRAILTTLTVAENLALGSYARKDRDSLASDYAWVYRLFPVLKERAYSRAGNLSGGEQQMLAIGRALMAKPRVLLLDEPSMGLAPLMVKEIFRILQEINETGLTILLVEQNVRQALKISRRAYVLENGKIVLEGTSADLLNDPKVIAAYLGG